MLTDTQLAAHFPPTRRERTVIHLESHRPVLMVRDPGDTSGLQTAAMVYQEERRERDPIAIVPADAPSCTSDRCSSGDRKCPTPAACRLPEDPEDVHRGPIAWIVLGFLIGWLFPDKPRRKLTDQARGERAGNAVGWFVLGLLLLMLGIAVFARPEALAWLRGVFA